MLPATRDWLDGLHAFAAARRREKPVAVSGSPAEQAAERMILATQLSLWLAGIETVLGERRLAIGSGRLPRDADPDPAIVITSSPIGIAVVHDEIESGSLPARAVGDRVVAVTELEYRLWCIRHSDDDRRRHINIWNWVKTSVPRQRHGEFARHPLAEGQAYWLHRAGIAGAGAADRRDCHLWRWNGSLASLLEAFVTERGVNELG